MVRLQSITVFTQVGTAEVFRLVIFETDGVEGRQWQRKTRDGRWANVSQPSGLKRIKTPSAADKSISYADLQRLQPLGMTCEGCKPKTVKQGEQIHFAMRAPSIFEQGTQPITVKPIHGYGGTTKLTETVAVANPFLDRYLQERASYGYKSKAPGQRRPQ